MRTYNFILQVKICFGLLVTILILAACGGTGQDEGSLSGISYDFSGRIIDGDVAGALVFIDSNNNGTRDAWEACAFTDNDGYFSYNPATKTNYCSIDAAVQQRQYCLITPTNFDELVLRADGGYDAVTNEAFLGQMSRRVKVTPGKDRGALIISPLTTLLTSARDENSQTTLLNALDLGKDDLDTDYLNTDGSGSINPKLLNKAIKIHKINTVLSDSLTDAYPEIGDNTGTPNDASSIVYSNLAQEMISSGADLDNVLSSPQVFSDVLEKSENTLKNIYNEKSYTLPETLSDNAAEVSRITNIVTSIPKITDKLIDPNAESFGLQDAKGSTRALESLIIKTVNESENESKDESIDNALEFFSDDQNSELITALTESLSSDRADLSALKDNDFSGDDFDSVEEINNASTLPSDVAPFNQVGGLMIRISEMNFGRSPDKLRDIEAEFYFNGTADASEGALTACMKYIKDANANGQLGEGNDLGHLVTGTWSKLEPNPATGDFYRLLALVNYLGDTYLASMKQIGNEVINGVPQKKLLFDNGDKVKVAYSQNGFHESAFSIPTTHKQCRLRLPLRVDIAL